MSEILAYFTNTLCCIMPVFDIIDYGKYGKIGQIQYRDLVLSYLVMCFWLFSSFFLGNYYSMIGDFAGVLACFICIIVYSLKVQKRTHIPLSDARLETAVIQSLIICIVAWVLTYIGISDFFVWGLCVFFVNSKREEANGLLTSQNWKSVPVFQNFLNLNNGIFWSWNYYKASDHILFVIFTIDCFASSITLGLYIYYRYIKFKTLQ